MKEISGEDPRARQHTELKSTSSTTPWMWIAIAAIITLLVVSVFALTTGSQHGVSDPPVSGNSGNNSAPGDSKDSGQPGLHNEGGDGEDCPPESCSTQGYSGDAQHYEN